MSLPPSPPPQHHATYSKGNPASFPSAVIDRQKTTPFLLNFCYRSSAFHNLADFPIPTPSEPSPPLPAHLQIYTWHSCTLKELAHLLTSALPSILPSPAIGTRLSFRLVYPDNASGMNGAAARHTGRLLDEGRPRYITREMGSVVISVPSDHTNGNGNGNGNGVSNNSNNGAFELGGDDAEKTLADARFVIGDFIDCAVFPPLSDGSVVPRSSVGGRFGGGSGGGGVGFRENGYGGRGRGAGFGSGRGGYGGSARGDYGPIIPSGEWRRGERLPDAGGYRGGSGGYRGRGGRREPY